MPQRGCANDKSVLPAGDKTMSTPYRTRRTRHLPDLPRFRRRAGLTLCFGSALASLSVTVWAQAETAAPPVAASAAAPAGAAPDAGAVQLAPIVVVGTTPLLGLGTPLSQVPANVQTLRAQDIEQQHRSTLIDYFAKNLPSVDISDAQATPIRSTSTIAALPRRRCSAHRRACPCSSTACVSTNRSATL